MTEGTVSRWLKQVGDTVEADEALLEVSTDKVDTEIPSPTAGTVLEIRVQEDETVQVGSVLAVIGEAAAATLVAGRAGLRAHPGARTGAPAGPVAQAGTQEHDRTRTDSGDALRPPPWSPPRPALRSPAGPQPTDRTLSPSSAGRPTTLRLATSPPSFASWPRSTASTWRPCRAPASVAAYASRTCSQRPKPPRPHRRRHPPPSPPLRRQRPRRPRPRSRATCGAPPRRCPGSARPSPSGWSSRCRSPRS